MSRKTTKHVPKPRFLTLRKYQGLHKQSVTLWAYNLLIRVELLSLAPEHIGPGEENLIDEVLKYGFVQKHFYTDERLIRTPTLGDIHLAISATENEFGYIPGQLSKILHDDRLSRELIFVDRNPPDLMSEVYDCALNYSKDEMEIDICESIYNVDFLNAPVQEHDANSNYRLMRINMAAPENLIVDEFKKMLRGMRLEAERKYHKYLNPTQLLKYVNNMLLPYMDIRIYYQYVKPDDKSPTDAQIARWLFKDEPVNQASKLKDLTKKYFEEVMSSEFREYLKNHVVTK